MPSPGQVACGGVFGNHRGLEISLFGKKLGVQSFLVRFESYKIKQTYKILGKQSTYSAEFVAMAITDEIAITVEIAYFLHNRVCFEAETKV